MEGEYNYFTDHDDNEHYLSSSSDEEEIPGHNGLRHQSRARFVEPQLLRMVHERTRNQSDEMLHRPEVLENWLYNWQTKERKIPQDLVMAANAIKFIENAFQHLKEFHNDLHRVSTDLQPGGLLAVDKLADKAIRTYSGIIRELEEKINAIRLYWFPETVEQFMLGAYKSVRQYVQDLIIHPDDNQTLVCSTCLDSMASSNIVDNVDNSGVGNIKVPVVFRRRCQINPLLHRRCDTAPCECVLPSICLDCALDHLLKNGLHEGKSSVRCPACRGEVCIYDVQEIHLIVKNDAISPTAQTATTTKLITMSVEEAGNLEKLNQLEKQLREEIAREREMLEREKQIFYELHPSVDDSTKHRT